MWLEVLRALMAVLPREAFSGGAIDRRVVGASGGSVRLEPVMYNVRLGADARNCWRLVVQGDKGIAAGLYRDALRQI